MLFISPILTIKQRYVKGFLMNLATTAEKSDLHLSMSNELIRSVHGLNLMEKRLLSLAISKLDSKAKPSFENMSVKINVSEMVSEFGLNPNKAYQETQRAAAGIMKRQIRFTYGKGYGELFQWVTRAKYKKSEGWVLLEIYPRLAPWLFELQEQFTSYRLSRASAFKSVYSWRLFELLMQFKSTGFLKIDIDEFAESVEAPETYKKDFGAMRRKAIEPAVKEIQEVDGLKVKWEPVKAGRKVKALEFYFPVEQQAALPLSKPQKSGIDEQVKQYVNANPQKTIGKTYPEIIQMMKEEQKKAKAA